MIILNDEEKSSNPDILGKYLLGFFKLAFEIPKIITYDTGQLGNDFEFEMIISAISLIVK